MFYQGDGHPFEGYWLVASFYMGLICARYDCQEGGAASLQFDTKGSRVLLVDLTESVAGIPVCARHAQTRTAPMGWELVDLRTVVRQVELFEPQPTTDELAVVRDLAPASRPSRRRDDPASPFTWDRQAREEANYSAAVEENPESPLLSRAFRLS